MILRMHVKRVFGALVGICIAAAGVAGTLGARSAHAEDKPCSKPAAGAKWTAPGVYSGDTRMNFEQFIEGLQLSRAVLVGENHERYDHHLNQLEILCRLHGAGIPIALGLESFQQPFQWALDEFLAQRIDEEQMLRETEYFSRWRYDYRLYAPLLRFARDKGVPVVALNVPRELTKRVAEVGLAALDREHREQLPESIDRSDDAYRTRMRRSFQLHSGRQRGVFEHFLEAQLVWDEGMAESATRYLESNT